MIGSASVSRGQADTYTVADDVIVVFSEAVLETVCPVTEQPIIVLKQVVEVL